MVSSQIELLRALLLRSPLNDSARILVSSLAEPDAVRGRLAYPPVLKMTATRELTLERIERRITQRRQFCGGDALLHHSEPYQGLPTIPSALK